MTASTAKMLTIIALAAMLVSFGFSQKTAAEYSSDTVWMNITNTKTGMVKELKWDLERYHFQKKIVINVDDPLAKRIKQIFGTDRFDFNTYVEAYGAKWSHFNVAIGMNRLTGTNLSVVFAGPDSSDEHFILRNYKIIDFVSNDAASNNPDSIKPATNSLKIFLSTDKNLYRQGERALIYVSFVDEHDRFVDPDSIIVSMNLFPTGYKLENKKVGSYTFVTPPLGKGSNQITVVAQKAMYNIDPASITATVLPEIPSAWYYQT